MNRLERVQTIMDLLEVHGNLSTAFLAGTLEISESSVRRDIGYMESLSMCKHVRRVHGGVVLDRGSETPEYMFEIKLELNEDLKRSVAKKAVELVDDGDSIVIDSGSTCLLFARHLHGLSRLKAVTTDVVIAGELARHADIESSTIGGTVRPGFYSIGGAAAVDDLQRYRPDKAFLSVDAIDLERGITNASEFEIGVKRKIIEVARSVIVLADHTKFGRFEFYHVADLSSVTTIVTDSTIQQSLVSDFRKRGIRMELG